jgi:hypothetical protein
VGVVEVFQRKINNVSSNASAKPPASLHEKNSTFLGAPASDGSQRLSDTVGPKKAFQPDFRKFMESMKRS